MRLRTKHRDVFSSSALPTRPAGTSAAAARTATVCVHPLAGVLVAGEQDFLGPNRTWNPVNVPQHTFLKAFSTERPNLHRIPEMESIASKELATVNSFLKARGFSIQLPPLSQPYGFYAASVLKVVLKWLQTGKETTIRRAGEHFPGAVVTAGVEIFRTASHSHPLVKLATQNGDTVWMTVAGSPGKDFPLLNAVRAFDLSSLEREYQYAGVEFPKVDLNQEPDISWLQGMWTTDQMDMRAEIEKALQQTKFKMNHIGALVESGVAVGVLRLGGAHREPYLIDRPFLLWINRPGLTYPLFAAWIAEECWRDPGNI